MSPYLFLGRPMFYHPRWPEPTINLAIIKDSFSKIMHKGFSILIANHFKNIHLTK